MVWTVENGPYQDHNLSAIKESNLLYALQTACPLFLLSLSLFAPFSTTFDPQSFYSLSNSVSNSPSKSVSLQSLFMHKQSWISFCLQSRLNSVDTSFRSLCSRIWRESESQLVRSLWSLRWSKSVLVEQRSFERAFHEDSHCWALSWWEVLC